MVLILAACGSSPATTASPTPTAPSTAGATPVITVGPGVTFNACGPDRVAAPTPILGGSPAAATETTSDEALAIAHTSLLQVSLQQQQVYCKVGKVNGTVATNLIPSHPAVPPTAWAVVAFITVQTGATPVPSSPSLPVLEGMYEVFFVSATHPVHTYGIVEYPPGVPLPAELSSLDANPHP